MGENLLLLHLPICLLTYLFYNHFTVLEDSYHTVGFKLVSAFTWISNAFNSTKNGNLRWILKMDDDVLLNIRELKNYMSVIDNNSPDSIHCRVYKNSQARREEKASEKDVEKWYDDIGYICFCILHYE